MTTMTTEEWVNLIARVEQEGEKPADGTIIIAGVTDEIIEGSAKVITSGGVFKLAQTIPKVDDELTDDSENAISAAAVSSTLRKITGGKMNGGYVGTNEPVYIFQMDPAEDDPAARITYPDYAPNAGFNPANVNGLGDWENTFIGDIAPCTVSGGKVNYWLNKNNIFKKADGTDAVLTGADGDVCTAIPTVYWAVNVVVKKWISTTEAERVFEFAVSHGQFEGSEAHAHRYDSEVKPYLFVGCFEGLTQNNVLRSVYSTTATPTVNQTNDTFQTQAAAGGAGYSLQTYNTWTLLALLDYMIYKNTNMQAVIGLGNVNNSAALVIGSSYRAQAGGHAYGTTANGTTAMRELWIENRYGDVWECVVGILKDANDVIWINTVNTRFPTQNTATPTISATDHVRITDYSKTSGQYTKSIRGTAPAPFLPLEGGATSDTFMCDYYWYSAGLRTCFVGGNWGSGASCGVACVSLNYAPSGASSYIGARLQILGTA